MNKSPEIVKMIDKVAKDAFGRTRTEALSFNICVDCGNPAEDFNDEVSAKEYTLSGFCQECQDKVFGDGGAAGRKPFKPQL